jgi:probable H4MPT-linked C1 transfer pathway protein
MSTVGWDIGGVNTKVARVTDDVIDAVQSRPYELQREPHALVPLLRELAGGVGATPSDRHAVTMTAELSQMFRTKREGVSFVLDAIESVLPPAQVYVFTVDGRFVHGDEARRDPLAVAAANWAATAYRVAASHRDALLIDTGTTSTDIIPIVGGRVDATGRTDPARLASGELVYTGVLRTPVEAIVRQVPYAAGTAGVSAEGFALVGDVHVWRGHLSPQDYSCPTPDGRPPTREFAAERLARVVCADREMLDEAAISAIADAVAQAQIDDVASAIRRVLARHPSLRVAVVTGLGSFVATAAARAAGLDVILLADSLGEGAARCAPATSVALLLESGYPRTTEAQRRGDDSPRIGAAASRCVDTVVKVGGGLLAHRVAFESVLRAIAEASRHQRIVIVPGGGPFADAVRDVDRRLDLSDEAAHWMAILGMDQCAQVIVSRLRRGVVVSEPRAIAAALEATQIPVLAPSRWMREADPLPHTWDVTSDSIAAWVAGQLDASRLMLVKPPGAVGDNLVDAYFTRALPAGVEPVIVAADRMEALLTAAI